jgi:hypothetical protein
MKDYGAFRKLLEEKGLIYLFHDDTGTYDIYRLGEWRDKKFLPAGFLISVPAQVARRNVAEAHDLIRTALELEVMFGS